MSKWRTFLGLIALTGCGIIAGSPNANAVVSTEAVAALPPIPGFSAVLPDPFRITFDEYGSGSYVQNGLPTVHSLTGTLQPDTTCCVGGNPQQVLTFLLPEPVVAGTLIIFEPGPDGKPTDVISDVVRFTDAQGNLSGVTGAGARMIFYSDLPETGELKPPPADTGFPTNLDVGNIARITEIGPEGNNFFFWQPGAPYPANNEYIGISDGTVPEPASLTLLLSGLAAIGLARLRRNRKTV